jgi:SMC interacting uncharacterized protein involved in chromosome segregation
MKSDPRPVSDKQFIQSEIKDLIVYLAANNFGKQLSPKMLQKYIMTFQILQLTFFI